MLTVGPTRAAARSHTPATDGRSQNTEQKANMKRKQTLFERLETVRLKGLGGDPLAATKGSDMSEFSQAPPLINANTYLKPDHSRAAAAP